MTESNGIEETEKLGDLTIFNVPQEDREIFRDITRVYGKKGFVAFRALIDSYMTLRTIGNLFDRLTILEEQVKELASPRESEEPKGPKTFGMKKEG